MSICFSWFGQFSFVASQPGSFWFILAFVHPEASCSAFLIPFFRQSNFCLSGPVVIISCQAVCVRGCLGLGELEIFSGYVPDPPVWSATALAFDLGSISSLRRLCLHLQPDFLLGCGPDWRCVFLRGTLIA